MAKAFDTEIRPEVRGILDKLKGQVRLYVCIEGLALVLVVLSILFWASLSIDWLWFKATKYELAVWFRVLFGLVAAGLFIASVGYWVVVRLLHRMQSKALALVLERRFPGLNDRLVTSVELQESISGDESPLTVSMLDRTVQTATQEAAKVHVNDVFEVKPVRWAVIGAVFTIFAIVGYGIVDGADLNRWYNAYVGMEEEYWDRETHLIVQVVASNGRVREFTEEGEGRQRRLVYKHPRGKGLTLRITIPKSDNPKGNPFVIPKEVVAEYQVEGSGRTKVEPCKHTGKRTFELTLATVPAGMKIWLVGHDYKNRIPYEIQLVEPPQVTTLSLICDYPAYTGKNDTPEGKYPLTVNANQVQVDPLETRFLFHVNTNKSLKDVSLEYGRYRLQFGSTSALVSEDKITKRVTYRQKFRARLISDGLGKAEIGLLDALGGPRFSDIITGDTEYLFPVPQEVAKQFFLDDGKGFKIPFIVSNQATNATRARFEEKKTPEDRDRGLPFLMEPGVDMNIYLEDTDEILNRDPGKLTVNAQPDEPPVVDIERHGISGMITGDARIPIHLRIRDDYGMKTVDFVYRVTLKGAKAPSDWRSFPFNDGSFTPRDEQLITTRYIDLGSILHVDAKPGRVIVNGNQIGVIQAGDRIRIRNGEVDGGFANNNGEWFVKLVRYSEGRDRTVITLTKPLPSSSTNGTIDAVEETAIFDVSKIRVNAPIVKHGVQFQERELLPGDVLTLATRTTDNDILNGPNVTQSIPEFRFEIDHKEIVTYNLMTKEVNQSEKGGQVLEELDRVIKMLESQQNRIKRLDFEQVRNQDKDALESMKFFERSTQRIITQVQKNHGETKNIEQMLRDIRDEYVNNQIKADSSQTIRKLELQVIQQLAIICEDYFAHTLESLDELSRLSAKVVTGKTTASQIKKQLNSCVDDLNLVISRLKSVISDMTERKLLLAAKRQVLRIKNLSEKVRKKIEEELKEALKREMERLKKLTEGG